MDLMTAQQLTGYLPIGVKWVEAQAQIDWCLVADTTFTASFFSETIQRRGRLLTEISGCRSSNRHGDAGEYVVKRAGRCSQSEPGGAVVRESC